MGITESTATGETISTIVNNIEEVLIGVPKGHCIIALLSMALVLQDPSISPAKLQDGVRDVSRFICLILDEKETEVMN